MLIGKATLNHASDDRFSKVICHDLLDAVGQSRTGRSFWFLLLLSVLGLLVIESLLAGRKPKRSAAKSNSTPLPAANTENA